MIEKEQPSGPNIPVVSIALGRYGSKALDLSASEWSGKVQTRTNSYSYIHTVYYMQKLKHKPNLYLVRCTYMYIHEVYVCTCTYTCL